MKNAKRYEKKLRKLLSPLGKAVRPDVEDGDSAKPLMESILQANATERQAAQAMGALEKEFVDFNELRAAPPRDIVECVGRDYPEVLAKAEELVAVLNGIYARTCRVSLEYMRDMPRRELRRHLRELGLDTYASARVAMILFDLPAVPVDRDLLESLQMKDYVAPDSNAEEVQKLLERIIRNRNPFAAHKVLRDFVRKSARALARKRKAEAKAKAEAEARAKAEAEAKARAAEAKARAAEAKAKAAEERKRKKAAKAGAAKKARKTKRARKKSAAGKTKKSARKAAKTAKKKPVRKARKKKAAKAKAKPRTRKTTRRK